MKMRNLLVAAGVFFVVQLAARSASADYVCYVQYHPTTATATGSEGYVSISTDTDAECQGSLGVYYFCTTGATSTSCPSNASNRYERHGILALYRALVDATFQKKKISVTTTSCNGGGASNCGSRVQFVAN